MFWPQAYETITNRKLNNSTSTPCQKPFMHTWCPMMLIQQCNQYWVTVNLWNNLICNNFHLLPRCCRLLPISHIRLPFVIFAPPPLPQPSPTISSDGRMFKHDEFFTSKLFTIGSTWQVEKRKLCSRASWLENNNNKNSPQIHGNSSLWVILKNLFCIFPHFGWSDFLFMKLIEKKKM